MVPFAPLCDPRRMRWLALVVLAACRFSPHAATDDARGGPAASDASSAVDAPGAVDAAAPAGFVRRIDLVDAQITGAPLADFPLLVSITAPWLADAADGGNVARADGFDLYFSADQAGTQRLSHEVEQYTPAAGALIAWVRIPSLAPDTVLYLHYGDASITTSQQDASGVWSGGYRFVAHLAAPLDSTGATPALSPNSVGAATGQIGGAQSFDGSSSWIDAASATAIDDVFASGGTAEGWFDANSYGQAAYGRLFDKGGDGGWSLYVANEGNYGTQTLAFRHGASNGSVGTWYTPDDTVTLHAWHHAAVVYDQRSAANTPVIYLDGVAQPPRQIDVPQGTMDSDAAADLYLGERATFDRAFDGVLDELRLSAVPRTADWIATEYRNQSAPSAFYTVSAPL